MSSIVRKQPHPNSLKNLVRGRWKPGESGNPSGRPRPIYKVLTEILASPTVNEPHKWGEARELARKLVDRAKRKSDVLMKEVLDRVDGPIPREVTGEAGGPLKIMVAFRDITPGKNGNESN